MPAAALATTPMPGQTRRWIQTCETIARFRSDARRSGRPVSLAAEMHENTLIALAPYVTPTKEVYEQALIANVPRAFSALVSEHGIPDMDFDFAAEVILSGETETAVEYLRRGGNFSSTLIGGLTRAIIEHDCPRRLALYFARLGSNRRSTNFQGCLADILDKAGPRLGAVLMAMDEDPHGGLNLPDRIIENGAQPITIKQLAVILSDPRPLSEPAVQLLDIFFGPRAMALIHKMGSAHGRLELARMEPDRAEIFSRPPNQPFFGLASQTNLVIDIPEEEQPS